AARVRLRTSVGRDTGALPPPSRSAFLAGQPTKGARPGLREDSLFSGGRDAQLPGGGRGLAARRGAELLEDRRDVVAGRLLGDEEAARDLGVAEPALEEGEHHEPASRELPRRGGRPGP